MNKETPTKEELIKYYSLGFSMKEIGDYLGCSTGKIHKYFHLYNITIIVSSFIFFALEACHHENKAPAIVITNPIVSRKSFRLISITDHPFTINDFKVRRFYIIIIFRIIIIK